MKDCAMARNIFNMKMKYVNSERIMDVPLCIIYEDIKSMIRWMDVQQAENRSISKRIDELTTGNEDVEPKFKVGDIIRGNEHATGRYVFTNSGMTAGIVTSVHGDDWMNIVYLSGDSTDSIGRKYDVTQECFDLVYRQK